MRFADVLLARRLEAAEAANARGCGAQPGAAYLEIAGGCAIFVGARSPLTQAVGIGLNGTVPEREIAELETFFRSRGAAVSIDLCPIADTGLLPLLAARGYRLTEFNNVLVKRLTGNEVLPAARVRRALPNERDLWSHTVGSGFFEKTGLTPDEMEVGHAIFSMEGAMCYLTIGENGEAAGGGAAAIHSGLMTLFADTTRRPHRGMGLHRELITARLNDAIAHGCDLASASTLPGSVSQRNFERLGFEVAYTKVTLVS
jgi:hypothetical protein